MPENRRTILKAGAAATAALSAAGWSRVLGANDRIRIGVIGCGGRGNFLIEQALRHQSAYNLEIGALCDVWSVNLAETEANVRGLQETQPQLYRRHDDLLENGDVDAVIIATPDFSHTPIMLDALRSGKDVFVEKPMATVLEHANEAVKVANASDRIVQVGNQRRSDARHHKGAALIQSGVLGKISEVETAWNDINPRWGTRDISNVREEDIDWEAFLNFLPKEKFDPVRFRRWHLWKSFTVGTPALLGAHLIDVGAWFMDDPLPTSAVAHGGVYVWKDGREHADTMECLIEYPKGFLLRYTSRFGNNRPTPEAIFSGTKGTFDTASWTARGDSGADDALAEEIFIEEPPREVVASSNAAGGQNDPRVQNDDHMINWLESLRNRKPPSAPVEVGYIHTVASIMSFLAWESGRRQVFDPEKRKIRKG